MAAAGSSVTGCGCHPLRLSKPGERSPFPALFAGRRAFRGASPAHTEHWTAPVVAGAGLTSHPSAHWPHAISPPNLIAPTQFGVGRGPKQAIADAGLGMKCGTRCWRARRVLGEWAGRCPVFPLKSRIVTSSVRETAAPRPTGGGHGDEQPRGPATISIAHGWERPPLELLERPCSSFCVADLAGVPSYFRPATPGRYRCRRIPKAARDPRQSDCVGHSAPRPHAVRSN